MIRQWRPAAAVLVPRRVARAHVQTSTSTLPYRGTGTEYVCVCTHAYAHISDDLTVLLRYILHAYVHVGPKMNEQ